MIKIVYIFFYYVCEVIVDVCIYKNNKCKNNCDLERLWESLLLWKLFLVYKVFVI